METARAIALNLSNEARDDRRAGRFCRHQCHDHPGLHRPKDSAGTSSGFLNQATPPNQASK